MVKTNAQKPDEQNVDDKRLAERQADATSAETVKDLEEAGVDSSSGQDPGPSPDGAFDESDENKDAGPM
jgi:hypothetical protein